MTPRASLSRKKGQTEEAAEAQVPILRNRVIALLDPALAGAISYPPPLDRVFYASSLIQILNEIKGETRPIVMIEAECLDEDDFEVVSRIRDLAGSPILVLMGLPRALGAALSAARRLHVNYILPADCMHHPEELNRWIEWIDRGGPDPGIAPHLERDTEIQSLPVLSRRAKPSAIVEVLQFVESAGGDGTLAYDIRLILEEAINNAFFHAFRTSGGEEKYNPENFAALDAEEDITVSFGADEHTIAISIRDSGGTLDHDTLLAKMERHAAERGLHDADGRGLFLIYSLAERLVFNVIGGDCTELVILFHRSTAIDRKPAIKPLLFFSHPSGWGKNESA